jgi:hypothetical protein
VEKISRKAFKEGIEMTFGIVDGKDWYKGTCARCKFAVDVENNGEKFSWAHCRRFPPDRKGRFPRIDPYYTWCGEFIKKNIKEE